MIGLLNAYHFDTTPGSYQEQYEALCLNYFQKIMPQETIKTYQVAQNKFPGKTDECSAWIITGSPASVYDNEVWIKKLLVFIQEAHKKKVKMLGICFGHQALAHALGGKTENSDKGWGVGIRTFKLHSPLSDKLTDECSLLFSHQDQVTKIPDNAKVLAGDDFCPNQIFSLEDHILSIQGHPEFTRDYAKTRLDERIERIGKDTYDQAVASLEGKTHEIELGEVIVNFLNS